VRLVVLGGTGGIDDDPPPDSETLGPLRTS